MKKNDLDFVLKVMSLSELKSLEIQLSKKLFKVRNGIIDESFSDYNPEELEQLLKSKILQVQNQITARKIRGET